MADYSRTRRAMTAVARGKVPAMRVSARRSRTAVERLRRLGWSISDISRGSGVSLRTLHRIIAGAKRVAASSELSLASLASLA